jgi:endonuclease/exonuclease/phosphatase family metal-dependent hydrolase
MQTRLLTPTHRVQGQAIHEPTLPTLFLTVAGLAALVGLCVLGMATLAAFGHLGWTCAALAAVLAVLVVSLFRESGPGLPPSGRRRWLRRILGGERLMLIGVLACWLGLSLWALACPSGPAPAPKADPALVRVVTWNIHCGQDDGPPWQRFDWPNRKPALRAALDDVRPDILCVQEATPPQVAFLEQSLPEHGRVGVGRDGAAGGEHCAIYFDRRRFELLDGDTLWLEEPIDQPRPGSALSVKRICTWVRLRDRDTGRTLRVYNTHLYLTEGPRRTGAKTILSQIAAGDPADAVLLTADFNAAPDVPSRKLFLQSGLADSAARAGKPVGRPTFHFGYGIGCRSIDAILVDAKWKVPHHCVVDVKPNNTFPSDHYGVLADLAFKE